MQALTSPPCTGTYIMDICMDAEENLGLVETYTNLLKQVTNYLLLI